MESDKVVGSHLGREYHETAKFKGGIKVGGRTLANFSCADDTTLIRQGKERLLELLERVKHVGGRRGWSISIKKTNVMVTDTERGKDHVIRVSN